MKVKINILIFIYCLIMIYLSFNLFGWTNHNKIIGFFVPRNESVFERLKLFFYPISLLMLISMFYYKWQMKVFSCYVISSVIGMIFFIIAFYTYSGIIGRSYFGFDVVLMIGTIGVFIYFRRLFFNENVEYFYYSAMFLYALLLVFFVGFSFSPPNIAMFK